LRARRFLNFIVLEALEGRGDQLKEYVIGVQVFGKEETFDPRTDPIVRVQAIRMGIDVVAAWSRKTNQADAGAACEFHRQRRRCRDGGHETDAGAGRLRCESG